MSCAAITVMCNTTLVFAYAHNLRHHIVIAVFATFYMHSISTFVPGLHSALLSSTVVASQHSMI
ncbi:hypothetical protein EG68_08099 [Paragonimus skrjabini miyazakii]|uniref:Uncharacterized protein n=1 Tax=Paragonimus skrjabini miyazakii TaxID=59628 RepID=A0A8S9YK30_9TREM|nr:hypothetical protein EG68_08099 [Paragonimus skrjabini miyazakii]